MTANGWIQILFFFGAILAVTAPLGVFMHRVLEGESHFLPAPARLARAARLRVWRCRRPRAVLASLRRRPAGLQRRHAARDLRASSACSTCCRSTRRSSGRSRRSRLQHRGELHDQHELAGLRAARPTMSYLSQMAGLAWHNFISAAAGIAIAVALARGLTRRGDGTRPGTIGNFWVDLTRATVYVLLPISLRLRARASSRRAMIQNLVALREVDDPRGREADDRDGAGRLAGGDQAARDERRRLLQRERRAPVREPERRSRTSSRCS